MKRTALFLPGFIFFISFFAQGDGCYNSVKRSGSFAQRQSPEQLDLFSKSRRNLGASKRESTVESLRDIKPKVKLTKKEIEAQVSKEFLLAFKSKDAKSMMELVREFPFLKEIRFTDPSLLEEINKKNRSWCPEGWSPLQIEAYRGDIWWFDFFLKLGMDIRARKKPGGGSKESNPLHISIKRDFYEGASRILDFIGYVRFGQEPNRFIDEKDHLKQTPWHLAVNKDSLYRRNEIRYISLIGRYRPSGYVKSYTFAGARDGYQIAALTGRGDVKRLAEIHLIAPNYDFYQSVRQRSSRPALVPP